MPAGLGKTGAPDGHVPEIGLGRLFRGAHFAFNRLLRVKLAVHGVTFSQFQHLRTLWVEDGLSQAELSRRIGIERASSTQVIESLARAGLIRRERDPKDARKFKVFLSPSGTALQPVLWDSMRETNAAARDGMAESDLATVFRCLSRIVQNLDAAEAAATARDAFLACRTRSASEGGVRQSRIVPSGQNAEKTEL